MKNETKEITVPKATGIDGMIQLAIKSKSGVEQLEKLMEMKYKHEEREAKKVFHEKFCEMQSELPIIEKTKTIKTKAGDVMYRYAPLEKIVPQIKPCLKKYGFSYHWTESFERENYKRVTCHITGHGHSMSAFADVPLMPANDYVNKAQQSGSSSTYGKRYSLSGILGIMVDEDVDGVISKKAVEKVEILNGNDEVDKYLTELARKVPKQQGDTVQNQKAKELKYMMDKMEIVCADVLEKPIDSWKNLTAPETNELWTIVYTHWMTGEKTPLKKLNNKGNE